MTEAAGDLRCAACGETEALHGKKQGDEIEVTCERCGATWTRKPGAVCERCGGALEAQKEPIVERVRGTQMSLQGFRIVYRCPSCDGAV